MKIFVKKGTDPWSIRALEIHHTLLLFHFIFHWRHIRKDKQNHQNSKKAIKIYCRQKKKTTEKPAIDHPAKFVNRTFGRQETINQSHCRSGVVEGSCASSRPGMRSRGQVCGGSQPRPAAGLAPPRWRGPLAAPLAILGVIVVVIGVVEVLSCRPVGGQCWSRYGRGRTRRLGRILRFGLKALSGFGSWLSWLFSILGSEVVWFCILKFAVVSARWVYLWFFLSV